MTENTLRTAAQGAVERLLNLATEIEAYPHAPNSGPLSAIEVRRYAEDVEYLYAPDFDNAAAVVRDARR